MDTAKTISLVSLEQEAITVRNEMAAITVTDQLTYDEAVEKRTAAASWLKNAREFFKGMKDPAYAAWKKICSNENLVCDPVDSTVKQINRALLQFDQEQERLRREAQRRLEDEARQRAEEERLVQAAQMEAEGVDEETLNAVLDAPMQITEIAVAAPTYERSNHVQYRDNWGGECFDLLKLVQFVAKNKQHINLVQINQSALTQLARALKESMDIPGIRSVNNKVVATGRG